METSTLERIQLRTTRTTGGCLEYTGARSRDGYGVIRHDGRTWLAHRLAFQESGGTLSDGDVVRHTCDNPPCCEPGHLISGTQGDNVRDSVARDRFATGENMPHKLTDDDVAEIRSLYAQGVAVAIIARSYPSVSRVHVGRVARGERRARPTNGRN